jgi:hypothetical protein
MMRKKHAPPPLNVREEARSEQVQTGKKRSASYTPGKAKGAEGEHLHALLH